jgi:integrase
VAAQSACNRLESLARQNAVQVESKARQNAVRMGQAGVPEEDSGELMEAGLKLIQQAHRGTLSEQTARDYVNRVLKASGAGSVIAGETVREFFKNWMAGKEIGAARDTFLRYRSTVDLFLAALGKRADVQLSAIGARDFERFRDSRLKEVGASTVSDDLKILRSAFNRARRQGTIHANPCEAVDIPKSEAQAREPFTASEVAALVEAAPKEWKTVILLGFYAGLRLGDAVRLTWDAVDFDRGLLTFRAQKTKRMESLPIHKVLSAHLNKIAGDKGGAISPGLAKLSIPGRSGLSRQFLDIVNAAGLGAVEGEKLAGKRRRFTAKSFHSLRHGFVSAMANQGVSKELRMKLAGHTSEDVASGYTHHEAKILRAAIGSIPSK